MRRFEIGLGLLLLLLAGSFLVQRGMNSRQAPIAQGLEAASQAAADDDWLLARERFQSAAHGWQAAWPYCAAFADHGPLEDIDSLFCQAPAFLNARDTAQFIAVCRELTRRTQAVADAQTLNWGNLL